MKKLLLMFVATFIVWQPAEAIVELRAGYGIQQVDGFEIAPGVTYEVAGFAGFNLDAILELPMLPVGLGLRYEKMGFDLNFGGQTGAADFDRTSVLVNYRIIDLFAYFGFIGSIGLVNDVKLKSGGLITTGVDYKSDLTYTVGVEGGVSLGLLMFGAEVGYLTGSSFVDQSSTPGRDFKGDGIYAKVLVGVGL